MLTSTGHRKRYTTVKRDGVLPVSFGRLTLVVMSASNACPFEIVQKKLYNIKRNLILERFLDVISVYW